LRPRLQPHGKVGRVCGKNRLFQHSFCLDFLIIEFRAPHGNKMDLATYKESLILTFPYVFHRQLLGKGLFAL
jgi:hypothetical protein